MSFSESHRLAYLPSSSLLVAHITRYARASNTTKNPINLYSGYLIPVPHFLK